MREDMDLAGRKPGEAFLDESLDTDTKEHVFALKRDDKVLAVARLQQIESPLRCFYFRELRVDPDSAGEGYASTLMQEVSDIFKENGSICIGHLRPARHDKPEQLEMQAKAGRLLEANGWRQLKDRDSVWALNLPPEDDFEALRLDSKLFREGLL